MEKNSKNHFLFMVFASVLPNLYHDLLYCCNTAIIFFTPSLDLRCIDRNPLGNHLLNQNFSEVFRFPRKIKALAVPLRYLKSMLVTNLSKPRNQSFNETHPVFT